jgi:S-DNA-T family DNA segregation ATPase FtsK/SpoIIIE
MEGLVWCTGIDEFGNYHYYDIISFPHLLLGGTTTSGKSSAIRALLTCLAYKFRNGNVQVILADLLEKTPSDFEMWKDYPFMAHSNIIRTAEDAAEMLLQLEHEMTERLKDAKTLTDKPFIVCVIDEFPKLFSRLEAPGTIKLVEKAITLLLSTGRHARIHLVLSAQNPLKKHMVCGIANIPARMCFKVPAAPNSVAVIGRGGGHKLTGGRGQMIFDTIDIYDARLRASFISEPDTKELLEELKGEFKQENQYPFNLDEMSDESESSYKSSVLQEHHRPSDVSEFDKNLADVIVRGMYKMQVSNDSIQKQLGVGYHKANEYLKKLEELNLVEPLGSKRGARKFKVFNVDAAVSDFLIKCGNEVNDVLTYMGRESDTDD